MERYLIFDSNCPICCNLAQAIEEATNGRLEPTSIHGAQAKQLLDWAYPNGWGHQPYLISVDDQKIKSWTGTAMALNLGLLLGPRKAWTVWKLSRRYGINPLFGGTRFSPPRRKFLGKAILFLASLLFVPRFLSASKAQASTLPLAPRGEGELYNGFVLLREGEPVPSIVQKARFGIPLMCGVGGGMDSQLANVEWTWLSEPAELMKEGRLPIYTISKLPDRVRAAGGYVVKHPAGEVFAVSVNYDSYQSAAESPEPVILLWAFPDFPRPFPLWSSEPVESGGPSVVLEKVDFLPSPGIMVATQDGFVFHWIHSDVLYTLIAEPYPSRESAQVFASSLEPVK